MIKVLIGVVLLVLGAIKVKNEFAMTKAYNAQAVEQKRLANVK